MIKMKKVSVTYLVHEDLKLSDEDLNLFLGLLTVDIHASSFEDQYQDIINSIKLNLKVSEVESELYHYNSALKLVKKSIYKANKKRKNDNKI
ncbi:MAG: hypothetical protein MH186_10175 [Marinobacter sp.]|nr:hypothetical protein [Marinobacter sp.]